VVANPPFSTKSWSNGFDPEQDLYNRFEYGIPPKRNGDYAFVLHILTSMKSTGKGAIVMPHGVLFRGNAEEEIRRNLITKGYIKGVISLPPNLFYGTGIPACILLLDKEQAGTRKGIFMIDASEGYMKDGAKNRLRHQDIRKIVDVFNGQVEIPGYSRLVPYNEIRENEYNLNIPRYIDNSEPEVIQDIEAHLKGGIPNRDIDSLGNFWSVFPSLKDDLFEPSDREGYSNLKVNPDNIRSIIEDNKEYQDFFKDVNHRIDKWWSDVQPLIKSIEKDLSPKVLIDKISEQLLKSFEDLPLINRYDVYQQLMDYWTESMQDDIYLIVQEGWIANQELIPNEIIAKRFFSELVTKIGKLEENLENLDQKMEELELEHGGDEGLLEEAKSDAGNITKSGINRRIKEISDDPDFLEELSILNSYKSLYDQKYKISKEKRKLESKLSDNIKKQYEKLSSFKVEEIILESKWYKNLKSRIMGYIDIYLMDITNDLQDLISRYSKSLRDIEIKQEKYSDLVFNHLKKMGY
jgi:type I restriction enzyme M protein